MKKISLILLLSVIHNLAFTQKKLSFPFSGQYSENSLISFGIQYNYVYQNFQLGLKNNWQSLYPIDYPKDNILYLGHLKGIRSKSASGFSVGIPIDIRITQHLYFNTSPSFLFLNNLGIEYQSLDIELAALIRKGKHELSSVHGDNFNAFEIPFNIKLRSDEKILKNKFNRYRVYLSTGLRYNRWIGINKEYKNSRDNNLNIDPLIFKADYLSWEAGLGIEVFFESFKVSPEIKFIQSFDNVLDNKNTLSANNKFMKPIEKALIRNIQFGIIFQ